MVLPRFQLFHLDVVACFERWGLESLYVALYIFGISLCAQPWSEQGTDLSSSELAPLRWMMQKAWGSGQPSQRHILSQSGPTEICYSPPCFLRGPAAARHVPAWATRAFAEAQILSDWNVKESETHRNTVF